MDRLLTVMRENPPTVGEAAVTAVVATLWWLSTLLPDTVPDVVVWGWLVFFTVLAIGLIGKLTQRFTVPTDWLEGDDALRAWGDEQQPPPPFDNLEE
jgi:hypothetical protein